LRFSPPPTLPEDPVTFARPPVAEVALAVQLDRPVVDLDVLAEITPRVRSEFPRREQHPPLPPMTEDFPVPPRAPGIQVEFATEFALPRSWFINQDETRLLQLQADRFALNWRRQSASEVYPRYQPLRSQFADRLEGLWQAIEASGKELPGVNLCEVTYVNHIEMPTAAPGTLHGDLGHIVKLTSPLRANGFLPSPEDESMQARFRIVIDDSPVGRLYVTVSPAFRPDAVPIYVMTLVSRILPQGLDMPAMWGT
jgi:hypothetical protein